MSQNQDYARQQAWFSPSDSCLTDSCSLFEVSMTFEMEVVGMTDTRAARKSQTSNSLSTCNFIKGSDKNYCLNILKALSTPSNLQ